jgi:hypothetical protein
MGGFCSLCCIKDDNVIFKKAIDKVIENKQTHDLRGLTWNLTGDEIIAYNNYLRHNANNN